MHRRAPLALALGLLLAAGTALAADWPQFRGPNRDGVSRETGLLKSWPAGGPKVLWKAPAGEGYSHLVVSKGRLFTLYGQGSQEVALALDAATGRQLWKVAIDRKYQSDMGNGPRSTPTVDGDLVYVLSANARLAALGVKDGRKVWEHDLRKELGARIPGWGASTSPLVEGNLLLVDVGGSGGKSLAAFDKKTGKVVWTSQNDSAGYSAPIAVTVGGVRQVIFFTGTSVVSVSPRDGKLFWRVPWRTDWDVNAATPIFVAPDKVFISSGYGVGAALFQIKAAGGKAGVEEVWRSRGMKNQFSSSVLHNGVIYGFDDSTFKAIDAATGKERWKQRGFSHGSLILADGHLIVLAERGCDLALVEATPQAYREKGRTEVLSGKCWTAPTVANGRLYLRNESDLVALDWTGGIPKPGVKGP
ncbi:MAG TPA: PQQ-binding-like beta-propeller repeat protein [Thermoanaerobaculia bacterium]|nr:PQQ-binding-like beta-propeller repeat protein [Thermoanaerobaculia bacterium]